MVPVWEVISHLHRDNFTCYYIITDVFLSFFMTQPAWAQKWICEDVIAILWFEKQYLQDDKWVKISTYLLCVSSSVKSGIASSPISSMPTGAIHVKEYLATDSLRGLDHQMNRVKAVIILIADSE